MERMACVGVHRVWYSSHDRAAYTHIQGERVGEGGENVRAHRWTQGDTEEKERMTYPVVESPGEVIIPLRSYRFLPVAGMVRVDGIGMVGILASWIGRGGRGGGGVGHDGG